MIPVRLSHAFVRPNTPYFSLRQMCKGIIILYAMYFSEMYFSTIRINVVWGYGMYVVHMYIHLNTVHWQRTIYLYIYTM